MKKGFLKVLCFAGALVFLLPIVGYCDNVSYSQESVASKYNTKNNELFCAVKEDDLEKVKELIDNGADVNAKSDYGVTPLHYVQDAELAKLLIDNGADVNAKNFFGETPLDIVCHNEEIVTVLVQHGAMTSKPLIGIVSKSSKWYDNMPIGNYVMCVIPYSPAYFAGIEKGDIITEFCGVAVEDVSQLNAEKSKYVAGDEVELKVYKGASGKIETVKIKLAQNV